MDSTLLLFALKEVRFEKCIPDIFLRMGLWKLEEMNKSTVLHSIIKAQTSGIELCPLFVSQKNIATIEFGDNPFRWLIMISEDSIFPVHIEFVYNY